MTLKTHRTRPIAAALLVVAGVLAACTSYDPRTGDGPPPTQAATAAPTPTSTPGPTATSTPVPPATPKPTPPGPIGSAHVALTVATSNAVTIDVKDSSRTLLAARSGDPGDGATVEAYALIVTNLAPNKIRLTWTGGPCDSANRLFIDKARKQLLLVQPGCSGDAVATDRILDLTFTTPIKASDLDAYLQDGLDT